MNTEYYMYGKTYKGVVIMKTLKNLIDEFNPKFLEVTSDYNTYEFTNDDFKNFNDKFLGQAVKWYQYSEERLIVTL